MANLMGFIDVFDGASLCPIDASHLACVSTSLVDTSALNVMYCVAAIVGQVDCILGCKRDRFRAKSIAEQHDTLQGSTGTQKGNHAEQCRTQQGKDDHARQNKMIQCAWYRRTIL